MKRLLVVFVNPSPSSLVLALLIKRLQVKGVSGIQGHRTRTGATSVVFYK